MVELFLVVMEIKLTKFLFVGVDSAAAFCSNLAAIEEADTLLLGPSPPLLVEFDLLLRSDG